MSVHTDKRRERSWALAARALRPGWRRGLAAVLLAAILAVGALHTPVARGRVLSWATAWLLSTADIRADVGRLDYNLLGLSVSLEDVTLRAAGAELPFFQADRARIVLLPSSLWGAPAVRSIEIERPRVHVVRAEDGSLNLPDAQGTGDSEPIGPVRIRRLAIDGLDIRVTDAARGLDVHARDAALHLEPDASGTRSTGRLSVGGGIDIRTDQGQTRFSSLEGGMAFDGVSAFVEALTLEGPEGRLRLDGSVGLLADRLPIDLRFDSQLNLPRVAAWIGVEPAPAGSLRLRGTADGPASEPRLAIDAETQGAAWSRLGDVSVRAHGALAGSTATLDQLRIDAAGGELDGSATVGLGEGGTSAVRLRWRNIGIRALADAAGVATPLRSSADGTLSLDWDGVAVAAARGTIEVRFLAPPSSPGAVTLAGTTRLRLDRGQYELTSRQQLAGAVGVDVRARGRIRADDLLSTTVSGQVELDAADLGLVARALQAAAPRGGANRGTDGPSGAAHGSLVLGGTLGAPRVRGVLDATNARAAGVGPATVHAGLEIDSASARLAPLSIEVGPDRLTGALALNLQSQALSGSVSADLPELALLAGALPPEWRPEGSGQLHATIGGTTGAPAIDAEWAASGVRVADQRFDTLTATARLSKGVLTIPRLRVTQGEGLLTGTGAYEIDTDRYTLEVVGEGLRITPSETGGPADVASPGTGDQAAIPLDALFDVNLTGAGTLAAPQARGAIRFARLAWDGYALGPTAVDAAVDEGTATLTAEAPSLGARADASVDLSSPRRFTANATILEAPLRRLVDPAGPGAPVDGGLERAGPTDVAGAVTVHVHAEGDLTNPADSLEASGDVGLAGASIGGAAVRMDQPARFRYAAGSLAIERLRLGVGAATLSADGRLGEASTSDDGLRVAVTGPIADLLAVARVVPQLEDADGSGALDLQVRATGPLGAPDLRADLVVTDGSLGTQGIPPIGGVALRATYGTGLLDVQELRGTWQGATVTGSAQMPATLLRDLLPAAYLATLTPLPPAAHATLRIEGITPAALEPFVDRETVSQLEGQVDLTVVLDTESLTLEGARGDVTLDRVDVTVAQVPLRQTVPTRFHLADGRVNVAAWSWEGAGNRLDVTGGMNVTDPDFPIDLSASGSLDLRMARAFARELATAGRVTIDITATGPLQKARIAGRASVDGGDIILRDPRLSITGLRGEMQFSEDELTVRDMTAMANGGTVTIAGALRYPDYTLTSGSLTLTGRGIAMELPQDLRTELDADLTLGFTGPGPSLTGRVTVLRGAYRAPISLTGQLLTTSVATVPPAAPQADSPAGRVELGVSIVSAEPIVVDNNYGRLELESNLRVIGTADEPVVTGRLTVREGGQVYLGGQTYQIRRGTIDFSNPARTEPTFNLVLETRVQRYDITLDVTGTPETLEAELRSPGLSQQDVVSLLLTGQTSESGALVQANVARGQLLMLLSGELLDFAGRAVGLDAVRVGRGLGGAASDFDLLTTSADPNTRLTLTKALRRDVDIVFSQSLRESGNITWIAIARPLRNVEVRGATLDDNSRSYEVRHELTFGGTVPSRRAAPEARPTTSVEAVRFSGPLGVDEQELRRRLTLKAGSRFAFDRWQRDRDNLLAFYQDRGYLEARVTPQRSPVDGPDGAPLTLAYEIDPGPRTEIQVEGYTAPADLIERMKVAWTQAVFDGFLLEDLATVMRRQLVEDRYLRATVAAAVAPESGADRKIIVVSVMAGERTDDTRIVFRGNQHESDGDLEALIQTPDLRTALWLAPREVAAAIEARYRMTGFLAARVTVDPPVFEGRSATVPVVIDEGRLFTIADLRVVGVSPDRDAEVRKTFGPRPGEAFDPSALEPARRAVDAIYQRDGYAEARVGVTTEPDIEGSTVTVTLNVLEGRRQVLSAVDVQGASTSSPGLIAGALDLEIGQPVGAADSYGAQKRLYDTGVFQSADVLIEPIGEPPAAGEPQLVRAAVTVQELPTYRFRYGLRLTDAVGPAEAGREVRPALVVDLFRRNLFGHAISTGVAGQLETRRRLARGIFSLPTAFGFPATTSLFVTTSRENFAPEGATPFVEDKNELSAEQRFRPADRMNVSYGYSYGRTHVFEPNPIGSQPTLDLAVKVARLTGAFGWDTRDDPANARRGWFHSSGLEFGARTLGSDLRFVRYLGQQYYFAPMAHGVVLASAARIGMGRGFEQELIPSERFYAGGGTSVRGFAENGLGEIDFFGDSRGGNGLLLLNQEIRFPLFKWVRGTGFVDAGNVFARVRDLSPGSLEAGWGAGLRIHSPFALIRIDYGVPLTQRDQPSGRWYFGIGQAF